jgi:LPS export ABC transporter protein LptC
MTNRKKKILSVQLILLFAGIIIIFFTYFKQNKYSDDLIISKEIKKKIANLSDQESQIGDVFFNIEYSGIDLAGNRYILKSKEATSNQEVKEIVNMKFVTAIFYFKDDTVLSVNSNKGVYNNKTLDITFEENVKAFYEGSELFAEKAEYSNSKSFLTISEKVQIKDIRGTMFADKLFFDIKKQTLNIASFEDGKINTNFNLK